MINFAGFSTTTSPEAQLNVATSSSPAEIKDQSETTDHLPTSTSQPEIKDQRSEITDRLIMMVAGAPPSLSRESTSGAPPALDCSSSPTNASATSSDSSSSSTRSVPTLSSVDLASLFLKNNLSKQELPSYNMFTDPVALLTLSQMLTAGAGGLSTPFPPPIGLQAPTPSAAAAAGPMDNPQLDFDVDRLVPTDGAYGKVQDDLQYRKIVRQSQSRHCSRSRDKRRLSVDVHSSKLPCHIRQCHVAKPMFQCPACDFTSTYSKNNVKSHMVSLHGLAGDPISYMDQYAAQVEEFMKICFPNVRGRGRPMHGRTSPISPSSPSTRRNSQGAPSLARRPSLPTEQAQMMQAAAAMHAAREQQMGAAASQLYGLNPLFFAAPSLFPQGPPGTNGLAKSPTSLLLGNARNNNMLMDGRLLGLRGTIGIPPPMVKTECSEMKLEHGESTSASTNEENGSLNAPFAPKLQRMLTSKYIEYPSVLAALSEDDCNGTIFSASNVAPMVEKLDLSLFEGVVSPQGALLPSSVIEKDQNYIHLATKIAALQSDDNFKVYEVLYALHRLDSTVLPAEVLDALIELAPSEVDAKRIRQYEENNANLSDEEQFIVQLARIDRLEEKLFCLRHMANYKRSVDELLQSFSSLLSSTRSLRSSSDLCTLANFFLLIGNILNGDFNADLVHGFRMTDLNEIMDGCEGLGPAQWILAYERGEVRLVLSWKCFPEMRQAIEEIVGLLEPLVNVPLSSLLLRMHTLQEGNQRVERESRATSGGERGSGFGVGAIMAAASSPTSPSEFALLAQPAMSFLQDQAALAMDQLHSLLDFLGEPRQSPAESFQPEVPLGRLLSFVQTLQSELTEVDVVKNEPTD
ncbi:fozi-1 [Pristionchus pacificus]|uniref:Fozi-1 n=1 Tax=Pristionchus pacificus TaxID=54126 RepID=A0A2A6CI80_PRIPA|nr:fozi-1 [Pristionchus pacificus]|eukprot:PDM77787.1 fozi-1 [Pristionchus pacificus]